MFVNGFELNEENSSKSLAVTMANTYIIVDWDDTLLPTSWLAKNELKLDTYLIPDDVKEELRKIDQAVVEFLRKASVLYGKVLVITNALHHWVELSSQKFLPETHQLLFTLANEDSDHSICSFSSSSSGFRNQEASLEVHSNNDEVVNTIEVQENIEDSTINVFSARELFEKDFPNDPSAWKQMAFKKLLKSRVASKFFINCSETVRITKSLSESELAVEEETDVKRGLKRSFSEISLSTSDFNSFVELENESYEIETEFKDNDSFFSLDLAGAVNDSIELEWEKQESWQRVKDEELQGIGTEIDCCNLISIGDCSHDCESLSKLDIGINPNAVVLKTVKFVDFPTIKELLLELDGLNMFLDALVSTTKTCDLIVDRKKLL